MSKTGQPINVVMPGLSRHLKSESNRFYKKPFGRLFRLATPNYRFRDKHGMTLRESFFLNLTTLPSQRGDNVQVIRANIYQNKNAEPFLSKAVYQIIKKHDAMSATESNMLPLGTVAPKFMLVEPLTGQIRSLDELKSEKATLVMFICNHCPFVRHVNPQLVALAHDYMPQGVSIIAISANDVEEYPKIRP